MDSSKGRNVDSGILFDGGGDSGDKVQSSRRFLGVEMPLVFSVFPILTLLIIL